MSLYQGIGSEVQGGIVQRSKTILREQADQRGGMIGGKEGTAGYWKKGSGGGGSAFSDPRVQYERPYWQGLPPRTKDPVFDAGEVVYRKPVWRVDASGGYPKLITNKRRVVGKGGALYNPPHLRHPRENKPENQTVTDLRNAMTKRWNKKRGVTLHKSGGAGQHIPRPRSPPMSIKQQVDRLNNLAKNGTSNIRRK